MMLKRIAAYAFLVLGLLILILGLLTTMFFRYYKGNLIAHPWLFYLLGLLVSLLGYRLIRSFSSAEDLAATKQIAQQIADLKANGEKIIVDISNCEIRSGEYSEKREGTDAQNQLMQFITLFDPQGLQTVLRDSDNQDTVDVKRSIFICLVPNSRTGQTERYLSPLIPKDEISLAFYLEKQKQTFLYIDRSDRTRYYFDLDFLFEE